MLNRRRLPGRRFTGFPLDQVGNAKDSMVNLTPVSQARAETTRAGWAALLHRQAVPRVGERVGPESPWPISWLDT